MLVFGHAGITLGIAALSIGVLSKGGYLPTVVKETGEHPDCSSESAIAHNCTPLSKTSWITAVASYLDIRFLLLGSLLPDLIDKPIGIYLFREIFESGRIFCHTLLFAVIIALAGVYLFRRSSKAWLLALSFGVLTHLIFDQMWLSPITLLWPLYGLVFDKSYPENWLEDLLYGLLAEPGVFIPELLGVIVLIWFALLLLQRKKVFAFIKYGKVQ